MADLVTRLVLDNKNFDSNLKRSQGQIKNFEKYSDMAKGAIGKFAGAIGIAVGGVESFTAVINSNATSQNAWNDLLGTTKTSVDNFFSSLVNGDWSIWENGITNAISLSRKYTQALRELKTNLEIGDVHLSSDEKELNRLENLATNENNSKAVREQAFKDFKAKGKEAVTYIEGLSKDVNEKLSTMLAGKGVKGDKNVRALIFKYLDTSTKDSQNLAKYEAAKRDEEIYNPMRYREGATWAKKQEAHKKYFAARDVLGTFPKNDVNELEQALKLKNNFTEEEIQALLDYTDKIVGLEDRLESAKKQVTDLGKDFDKNGNLITTTKTSGSSFSTGKVSTGVSSNAAPSSPKVTLPTSLIPVNFVIPDTTLKELEDKRAAIIKKMNTANQDDYVKLKVELEKTDADIADFKNGKYGKPRGLKATPVVIKSSLEGKGKADYSEQIEGLNALATSLQTVSNLTSEGAAAWMTYGANILATVAAAIPAIAALTTAKDLETNANVKNAATGAAASQASIPIVGPILAVAAVASVLAALMALPKFATGGIVAGNNTIGDMNLARVNSGEMILNSRQQRNLFALLNNGGAAANGGNSKVEFKISGRELVGVLKNFNNKRNKVL